MRGGVRSFRPAILACLCAGSLVAIAGVVSLFTIFPPTVWIKYHGVVSLASTTNFQEILTELRGERCYDQDWPVLCRLPWITGITHQLLQSPASVMRLFVVALAIPLAALTAFFFTYADTPPTEDIQVLNGRRIETGAYAARALRKAIRRQGKPRVDDLWLLPGVQLNEAHTKRNILLTGSHGGGKTVVLRAYVDQLLAAPKGKEFIFDAKGDMTAGLPTDDFIFVAPHDARSWALDVGREITNPMIAREFAAKCTPNTPHDSMWIQATRATLADIAMALHSRSGVQWSWPDLANAALSSTGNIRDMLVSANARSATLLNFGQDPEENRTIMSVMITLWVTVLTVVEPLAQAWADVPPTHRFTVGEWLRTGSSLPRTLLFQKSSDYPELSSAVGSFLAERVAAAALSPSRRQIGTEPLTQVLDEFPEASIDRLPRVLALGRELQVTTIGTVQDLGQITLLFGKEQGSVVEARFGIRIVLRLEPGESVKRICDQWLGQRRIRRRRDPTPDELARGVKKPTEVVLDSTIAPDVISDDLGVFETPKGNVIRLLVTGFPTVAIMDVPLTTWPDRREAHVAARWMDPSAAIPACGNQGSDREEA